MIDFLVIGGGIAGVSAGARLSNLGKVVLLEAETALAYHTSGRSAAMFEETYGKPSTLVLNRASADYHFNANGGVLSPRGLILIGTADQKDEFEHDFALMNMNRISAEEAREIVPILNTDVLTDFAQHDEAWDIDTDRLIQNFAREIRANGGQVLTGQKVAAITRTANGWQVRTADKDFEAKTLVNAAGSWADQIAAMAGIEPIGLQAYRRSMARIPAPGGHDVSGWPMTYGAGETWYAKPDAGALLVSPAEEDPMDPFDAWPEDMVLAEGLAKFEAVTTEPVTRLISSWAGLRTFVPDRCLVLGPDPTDRSFVWSAGQGGYGFQTAPAASALVAALVSGTQPEIDDDTVRQLWPDRLRG